MDANVFGLAIYIWVKNTQILTKFMASRAKKTTIKGRYQAKKTTIKKVAEVKSYEATAEDVWEDTFSFTVPEHWFQLAYPNGEKILTFKDLDVMYEIASLTKRYPESQVEEILEGLKDRDDLLWGQEYMQEAKISLENELKRRQTTIKIRIGPGLCSRCQCTAIAYTEEDRMGLDEGKIQKAECTSCHKTWRK
jgi:hypothetical protein